MEHGPLLHNHAGQFTPTRKTKVEPDLEQAPFPPFRSTLCRATHLPKSSQFSHSVHLPPLQFSALFCHPFHKTHRVSTDPATLVQNSGAHLGSPSLAPSGPMLLTETPRPQTLNMAQIKPPGYRLNTRHQAYLPMPRSCHSPAPTHRGHSLNWSQQFLH